MVYPQCFLTSVANSFSFLISWQQCFGSVLISIRFQTYHVRSIWIRILAPDPDSGPRLSLPKWKKKYFCNFFPFFFTDGNLQRDSYAQVKTVRLLSKGQCSFQVKISEFFTGTYLDAILTVLYPDPYFQYGSGSWSRGAILIRIDMDPDPKHWLDARILVGTVIIAVWNVGAYDRRRRSSETSTTCWRPAQPGTLPTLKLS